MQIIPPTPKQIRTLDTAGISHMLPWPDNITEDEVRDLHRIVGYAINRGRDPVSPSVLVECVKLVKKMHKWGLAEAKYFCDDAEYAYRE